MGNSPPNDLFKTDWLDLKTVERFGNAWTGEFKFFSVEK